MRLVFSFEESISGLGLRLVDVSLLGTVALAGLLREYSTRIQGTSSILTNVLSYDSLLVSHNSITITGK